ncbi:MAG: chemotaxis protein CheX [Smithella sp.]|nr:chemotaxis protein CheX [Syntrophaceae bacterium]
MKIKQLLMNAIFEVFEKMFFVFLEPVEEDVNYDMIASINFAGPVRGSIDILLTSDLADAMVQNMLSVDEEGVTQKLIEDCVKEAVNMIGGNFLQKYDSSKVFDLSIPTFKNESAMLAKQDAEASEKTWILPFESSEGLLGVKMNFS